ncbi:MAG: DNA polymerase III subunit gamma/tau [Candidatus Magasanikbacteria bacterium]|nr:DNA polymerase III subunit gamma/tau [Candidatus Magasanikbacteria bacterium]
MALYHKYRPQNFSSVVGQEHIVKTISSQVASGKVAHAYLFSGARGIGKTTMARVLAKAVNCPNRKDSDFEPCDKCPSCEEISASRSIDVLEIDAASHTGVDNVRENIIDNAQFRPTKSKYKIFIIDEVHMLSTSAFNALLKTLEEPPEHVIFILATTELRKLPETIISRCQRFAFKKIHFDTMKAYLEKIAKSEAIKVDKEVVARIINKSDGCLRDAISLLDQIMATGEKNITADTASLALPTADTENTMRFIAALIEKRAKDAITLLNAAVNDGVNLYQFAYDAIELLRVMLIAKAGANDETAGFDLDEKDKKQLRKLNEQVTQTDLVRLIDQLMARRQQIKSSPLPQLPLEMAVIEASVAEEKDSANENDSDSSGSGTDKQEKVEIDRDKRDKEIKPALSLPKGDKKNSEEPKKTIVERVKGLVSKEITYTLDDVNGKWEEFLKTVETRFPSLSFILKMGQIIGLNGGTLRIGVGFSFHRDKLMEKICQKNLEVILEELIGGKVRLEFILNEEARMKDENDELKELASSLGGEIVS